MCIFCCSEYYRSKYTISNKIRIYSKNMKRGDPSDARKEDGSFILKILESFY